MTNTTTVTIIFITMILLVGCKESQPNEESTAVMIAGPALSTIEPGKTNSARANSTDVQTSVPTLPPSTEVAVTKSTAVDEPVDELAYPAGSEDIVADQPSPETPVASEQPGGYPSPVGDNVTSNSVPPPLVAEQLDNPYPPPVAESTELPVFGYQIINEYFHDPEAFTQGLVVTGQGEEFIEGTGLWGESTLRRVDIETGEVTQLLTMPDDFFGEGLTLFEDKIFQLTWLANTGFVYDSESFELLEEFGYPHEGWGITHDGQQLIVSDGTATIRFWDPDSLTETRRIQVTASGDPVPLLNELEYVDGEIFANVWQTDLIARISPDSGEVVGWIDLSGVFDVGDDASTDDVLNGIAYDGQNRRLFVTGKRWPLMFEIELIPVQ
jgi:glutamine cyclotransferase